MPATTLVPGYRQVDSFGPDEDYFDEEEEVSYVTLDLGVVEPTLLPSTSTYRLIVSVCPFIHGTDDNVVPFAQSERFCDKLRESKVGCEIYPVKGGGHGIRSWESAKLTDYKSPMVRWLQKVLAQP